MIFLQLLISHNFASIFLSFGPTSNHWTSMSLSLSLSEGARACICSRDFENNLSLRGTCHVFFSLLTGTVSVGYKCPSKIKARFPPPHLETQLPIGRHFRGHIRPRFPLINCGLLSDICCTHAHFHRSRERGDSSRRKWWQRNDWKLCVGIGIQKVENQIGIRAGKVSSDYRTPTQANSQLRARQSA